MFARYDVAEARLYDLRPDPDRNTDFAVDHPDIVERMWEGYLMRDAAGWLPHY